MSKLTCQESKGGREHTTEVVSLEVPHQPHPFLEPVLSEGLPGRTHMPMAPQPELNTRITEDALEVRSGLGSLGFEAPIMMSVGQS